VEAGGDDSLVCREHPVEGREASAGGALLGLIRLLSHDRTIDGISATDTVNERVLCLLGVAPQEAHILATTPLSQST